MLFLVSSSGVYLTLHYCSQEETTDLFFFRPLTGEPCEHHAHESNENMCCTSGGGNELTPGTVCHSGYPHDHGNCAETPETAECCSNTVLFIAVEDHFVKTDHPSVEAGKLIAHPGILTQMAYKTAVCNKFGPKSNTDPPPKLPARELTLLNRVLIL